MATIADAVMGPTPLELGSSLDLLIVLLVSSDALITPLEMLLEFSPMFLGPLQHQAGHAGDVVAGVLQHVVEMLPQDGGCLGQHDSELGQQTTDAVDAGRALFFEGFAQAMHAQHALLDQRFGRHEVHVRSGSRLADGGRIVGVVLAALALDPVRRDELRRDHAGIETTFAQLATPVVGTTASLHRHEAACGQLGTPDEELLAFERPVRDHLARGIDRVDLDQVLGQIDADSCNVAHGTSPSIVVEIDFQNANLGTRCRSPEVGSPFVFAAYFAQDTLRGTPGYDK